MQQNMPHFDYTLSNPPYQLDIGDRNIQSLYHKFMQFAQHCSKYVSMIYPSRWLYGGNGMDAFRDVEAQSRQYETFHVESVDKFFNIALEGDICYFSWNTYHNGSTAYSYKNMHETRDTLLNGSPVFVANPRHSSIVAKVDTVNSMLPYGRDHYGKNVSVHWRIDEEHEKLQSALQETLQKVLQTQQNTQDAHVHSDKHSSDTDNNDNSTRAPENIETATVWYFNQQKKIASKTVSKTSIKRHTATYKVFVSATAHHDGKAQDTSLRRLNRIFLGEPNDVISTSFLQIGEYDTLQEAANMLKYLKTDFATFLFGVASSRKGVRQQDFCLIPDIDPATGVIHDKPQATLDFSQNVDSLDAQLAHIYDLTVHEQHVMQSSVRPWKDKNSFAADGKF